MSSHAPKKTQTAVSATIAGSRLILQFANEEVLTVDADALDAAMQHAAMMHGLKQKLIDAAAIARDPETGRTATVDDKYKAVREVYDRITGMDGVVPTWNKVRTEGAATNNGKGGMFMAALMRMTSKSRSDIEAYLEPLSKEQIAALRKNPRVVELMRLIQAERTDTTAVDTDALLDGLMEGAEHADEEETTDTEA